MDWMVQQEVLSGFRKVNQVMMKHYVSSLQRGCIDEAEFDDSNVTTNNII